MIASCFCIAASIGFGIAPAQTAAPPESIRALVTEAFGASEMPVEISATPAVLTISRINSPISAKAHPDHSAEATFIAGIVAKAIKGSSQFSSVLSISIDFIDRSGTPLHDTLIDRIDFREDQKGISSSIPPDQRADRSRVQGELLGLRCTQVSGSRPTITLR